jgi:hypothetical protein
MRNPSKGEALVKQLLLKKVGQKKSSVYIERNLKKRLQELRCKYNDIFKTKKISMFLYDQGLDGYCKVCFWGFEKIILVTSAMSESCIFLKFVFQW